MDSDTLALLYFIVILLIMVNGSRAAALNGMMFCRNCQFIYFGSGGLGLETWG